MQMRMEERYEKTLLDIVATNKKTIFGSFHEFEYIESYADFKKKVSKQIRVLASVKSDLHLNQIYISSLL